MKKTVIKLFAILTLFIASVPAFCQSAVVTYVKGKVEVNRGDKWIPVAVGDSIAVAETLSTGFQSEAKLKYKGSVMAMGSLTRITIDELSSEPGKDTVNVYLNTGAVRSKVTHSESKVSHSVRSPVGVASVRGTDFVMSANGAVKCYEGAVVVYPNRDGRYAKKSSKSTGESDLANSGDYSAAESTTLASEITDDAPLGAVVVGADQQTEFSSTGNPRKPFDAAKDSVNKVKNISNTNSGKATVATSSNQQSNPTTPTSTGNVSIAVEFAQ